MDDTIARTKWLTDPHRLTIENLLIDPSNTTMENVKQARDSLLPDLSSLTSAPDPKKQPAVSLKLVSYQNRQWLYTLLQNNWTPNMKTTMQRYHKAHAKDGVILWYCFLTHFAGTSTENLIEAYNQLSESKLKLSLYNGNVLQFTNAIHAPLHWLIKAKETPSLHHYLYVLHGCMEAPNEEFHAFIFRKEAKFWKHGPTASPSLLDLLDDLDAEYSKINNLGRWKTPKDSQLLALMANFSHLQKECTSLKALLAAKDIKPPPTGIKKPPKWKEGDPEVIDFEGTTWKWCAKCFSGS
jgi:hypothetical protein